MGVFQVIQVGSDQGTPPRFDVVPSAPETEPESFESAGLRPAYFGSADLINLAVALEGDDYVPTDLAVADAHFERLEPEVMADETQKLLEAIRAGDRGRSLSVLADSMPGLIIEAVTLKGKKQRRGTVLRLLQDGVVHVVNAGRGQTPDEDIRRALRDS